MNLPRGVYFETTDAKLDKLDDAFLFSLGSIGIIISFIEFGKSSLTDLASSIPFLFLGVLLPFVVGYLRGAVQLNSIEERIRGWIYFLVGTISYFGFFAFTRINSNNYWVKECAFLFILAIGVTTAYEFVKWSRNLFNLQNRIDSYAFSATLLGVFGFSFLFNVFVGFFFDFQVGNIIRTSFTEQLFWLSIVLFLISTVLILEKGSRDAIENGQELQNEHKLIENYPQRLRKIWSFFPIKGLFLGLVLFEYSFDFNLEARNLQARTLWMLSFVFWFIGCLFWKVEASFVASLFLAIAAILCAVALVLFNKSRIYDFKGIDRALPSKISYLLVLFVLIILVLLGGNLSQLILAIVLWTLAAGISELFPKKAFEDRNLKSAHN